MELLNRAPSPIIIPGRNSAVAELTNEARGGIGRSPIIKSGSVSDYSSPIIHWSAHERMTAEVL